MTIERALIGTADGSASDVDPNFENVSLLLHGDGTNGAQNNTFLDSSTNNFTITRNGNTTQGSFSPYGDLWSNYFDGSGDYLSVPSNAALGFGTGDFTMEAWVYFTSNALDEFGLFGIDTTGGSIFAIYQRKLYLGCRATAYDVGASVEVPQNSWTHLAITRSSNTVTLWQNGVSVGTGTVTRNYPTGTGYIAVFAPSGPAFPGYISNLRIVKGTAVYTSNFTPSTTPLTAISGTSLLTCQSNRFIDNSSNNFAITVNGDTSVQPFSPFAPEEPYDSAVNGGSGYFPTTTSNLRTTSFSTGIGPWTLEAWFYFPSALPDYYSFFALGAADDATSWLMYKAAWNAGNIAFYSSTPYASFSPSLIKIGAWNHIVLQCGSSRDVRFFVNGVQASSATFGAERTFNATTFVINGYARGDVNGAICYIASPRVVVGTAVYGGTFTPPSLAPLSTSGASSAACYPSTTNVNTSFASSQTKLLCNFTNAGIFDNAMKNDLETVGNAQISTSVKKYGTGSMYMAAATANTDFLRLPASLNVDFGTGNFTIEFWMNPNSTTTNWAADSYATVLDLEASAGVGTDWWVIHQFNATLFFGSNGVNVVTSSSVLTASVWQHVAIVRNSGTITIYVNGTSAGSASYSTALGGNRRLFIGAQFGYSRWYKGYLDDLRITKGVARYTANFTPPTAAFPNQ